MKFIIKSLYLAGALVIIFSACNDNDSSKKVSTDTSEHYNPVGDNKNSSTYSPKESAIDTMYKKSDSITK